MSSENSKKLMVCLDLTDIDHLLIRWAGYLHSCRPEIQPVYLHIIQTYDLELQGVQEEEHKKQIIADSIRAEIAERLDRWGQSAGPKNILIREGFEDAALDVVDISNEIEADIVLVGEKEGSERSKWYSRRITRETAAHTIVIPESAPEEEEGESRTGADQSGWWIFGKKGEAGGKDEPAGPEIKRILYAADYREEGDPGLSFAQQLSSGADAELRARYVRDRTSSLSPAENEPTDADITDQQDRFDQACERTGTQAAFPEGLTTRQHTEGFENEARRIYAAAEEEEADLLFVNISGKPSNVTTLLGNLIVNMGKIAKSIPVFYWKS